MEEAEGSFHVKTQKARTQELLNSFVLNLVIKLQNNSNLQVILRGICRCDSLYFTEDVVMDVLRIFRNTREWITPVLHESAFTERGVLTPEEFVRAGDQLILKCPTWSWQSGEQSKTRPYLPADNQFLIIRGCPSHQRVTTMNAATVQDFSVVSDLSGTTDKDGDWCAPQILQSPDGDDEVLVDAKDFLLEDENYITTASRKLDGIAIENSITDSPQKAKTRGLDRPNDSFDPCTANDEGEIAREAAVKLKADEYEDMEDESLALDESATTANCEYREVTSSIKSFSNVSPKGACNSLLRSRRYDVSITYDKYYQVR